MSIVVFKPLLPRYYVAAQGSYIFSSALNTTSFHEVVPNSASGVATVCDGRYFAVQGGEVATIYERFAWNLLDVSAIGQV